MAPKYLAIKNIILIFFSDSPIYLSKIAEVLTLIIGQSLNSVAIALTMVVLPVPGGP